MSARPERLHTVAWGDTLATISRAYYGDVNYASDIYDANRGQLSNPNALQPYQRIVIPDLSRGRFDEIEEDDV